MPQLWASTPRMHTPSAPQHPSQVVGPQGLTSMTHPEQRSAPVRAKAIRENMRLAYRTCVAVATRERYFAARNSMRSIFASSATIFCPSRTTATLSCANTARSWGIVVSIVTTPCSGVISASMVSAIL